jgi:hypothetical protein
VGACVRGYDPPCDHDWRQSVPAEALLALKSRASAGTDTEPVLWLMIPSSLAVLLPSARRMSPQDYLLSVTWRQV